MKLGTTELLVILAIIIIIAGPSQLPKLSRMFGKSVKSLRDGMKEEEKDREVSDSSDSSEKD